MSPTPNMTHDDRDQEPYTMSQDTTDPIATNPLVAGTTSFSFAVGR